MVKSHLYGEKILIAHLSWTKQTKHKEHMFKVQKSWVYPSPPHDVRALGLVQGMALCIKPGSALSPICCQTPTKQTIKRRSHGTILPHITRVQHMRSKILSSLFPKCSIAGALSENMGMIDSSHYGVRSLKYIKKDMGENYNSAFAKKSFN